MFDKAEQQRRAAEFTAAQLAKGAKPVTLPPIVLTKPVVKASDWPFPTGNKPAPTMKPMPRVKPSKVVVDAFGMPLAIDNEVVYTRYDAAVLIKGRVLGFSKSGKSVRVFGKTRYGSDRPFWKRSTTVARLG